jgi:DNA-binding transcriptional MocR family regulator
MASSVADPELFHADEFITEIETMRRDSPWDFYYSEPEGCPELLQQIEKILSRECLGTSGSSHIATNGSMRGLEVLLEIFTNPGDSVLVQEPGRLWLSQLLRIKGVTGFAVKVAGSGIDLDHAQFLIDRHKPKLFFVAPDYGHATGLSMTGPERESVLRLCQSAGVFLVEDAASTALTYHSEKPPPIASLDKSSVAYVGSFSYSLCPALRSGFLHVPARLKPSILSIWEATSISGSRILQTALARYIEQGKYDSHLTRVLPKYRNRRDAMMTALKRAMPLGVSWTTPEGGFSTWLSLAPEYARPDLYASAVSRGVSFAPGSLFLTHGEPENHLRLSFGMLRPEEIEEAVKSLAKALKAK